MFGECPVCNGKLVKLGRKNKVMNCENCDFIITEDKILSIMTDKSHVMRQHITEKQKELLKKYDRITP